MLILASNSPRRKQLVNWFGLNFEIQVSDIDEKQLQGETPDVFTIRLAQEKAIAVAEKRDVDDLILAADTTVAILSVDGTGWRILGKPADACEAASMLISLRGRTHQVFTGVAVTWGRKKREGRLENDPDTTNQPKTGIRTGLCITDVMMRGYTDSEMDEYISSGDPLDKAGAYAIQHTGFHPVESIHGCYTSVVGLPVCLVDSLLRAEGLVPKKNLPKSCLTIHESACDIYQKMFPC